MGKAQKNATDITFDDVSLFGSTRWVCATLGRTYDWFMRNNTKLFNDGFPKCDSITGHYVKSDVRAWVATRQKLKKDDTIGVPKQKTSGENLDAF